MVSLKAGIVLALSAVVLATGYTAANGSAAATAQSLTQRIKEKVAVAARRIDNYGFYAQRLLEPDTALRALGESLKQARDWSSSNYTPSPKCAGLWDLHAHLPANISSEGLESIVNTAQERNVELIAVTEYSIGGPEALTYEGFLAAAEASGKYGVVRKGMLGEITDKGKVVLRAIQAQEVATQEGHHILVYGGKKRLQSLHPAEELLRQIKQDDDGAITVLAHPHLVSPHSMPANITDPNQRIGNGKTSAADKTLSRFLYHALQPGSHPRPMNAYEESRIIRNILPLVDGVEVRNSLIPAPLNSLARQMALNYNKGMTAGSDTHYYADDQLGITLGLSGVIPRTDDIRFDDAFRASLRDIIAGQQAAMCIRYSGIDVLEGIMALQNGW